MRQNIPERLRETEKSEGVKILYGCDQPAHEERKNQMHRLIAAISALVLLAVGSAGCARQSEEKAPTIICDKQYTVTSPDGEEELGAYRIRGSARDEEKSIEILEELAMDYRGRKIGWKSTVVYSTHPSLTPVEGGVETTIDGAPCMRGTVTLGQHTLSLSCEGLLDKKTGKKIYPPLRIDEKGMRRPEGVMIFQSVLPVIGPRFISQEGELNGIVFVEFPDDIGAPELITFKEGYRLVRTGADEEGRYRLSILSPDSDEPVGEVRFDSEDRPLDISSFGKIRLVESPPADAAATDAPQ